MSYSGQPLHGGLWDEHLKKSEHPHRIWRREVDDTFIIQKTWDADRVTWAHKFYWPMYIIYILRKKIRWVCALSWHLSENLTDPLQWQCTGRKPIDTELHLQNTVSVTPRHKGWTVFTPQLLEEEGKHLIESLQECKYPNCVLNRCKIEEQKPNIPTNFRSNDTRDNTTKSENKNASILVPYTKGISENCKIIFRKHGIQMLWKEVRWLETS